MNNRIANATKYWTLFAVYSILTACVSYAQTISHAQDVVIETPAILPVESRQSANAFYLNTNSGDGKAYLYIEQQDGKRLVVLDVTDLSRIKTVKTLALSLAEPFRFAEELKNSYIVLRSMNQNQIALLNIRKSGSPVLETTDAFQRTSEVQSIGRSVFLLVSVRTTPIALPVPQEYRIVESGKNQKFSTLYAVKGVIASIDREETGTLFLLGSDGLTVIRHPEIEEEYEDQQKFPN